MRSSSRILDHAAFEFITKRLFWHGKITRQDLLYAFGLGAAKATRLLCDFRDRHAGQLSEEGKGYAPTDAFRPRGVSGDRYLDDLLRALRQHGDPAKVAGEAPPARIGALLNKQVRTDVLRGLLEAFRRCEAVTIRYVGMRPGAQTTTRTVEPVELVYVNDRWHLRAFCYQVADWRDFVLSRIQEVLSTEPAKFKWIKTGYPRQVKKKGIFVPHPDLSDDQKEVVVFEYGMKNGMLEVELPEDDFFYFVERHVAKPGEGPPEKLLIKGYR